jgi:hypothetical protein
MVARIPSSGKSEEFSRQKIDIFDQMRSPMRGVQKEDEIT